MREPSPRASRFAIAGGLVALILVGGGGFLLGRATMPAAPSAPAPVAVPAPEPSPTSGPEKLIGRAEIIGLGAAGADALASGTQLPQHLAALAGKRFELALPFGCDGSAPDGSSMPMRWRYDEAAGALRIHVAPVTWSPAEWSRDPATLEAMEGFWIERPWSSAETCLKAGAVSAAPSTEPVTLPGQSLGVAQLITTNTARQLGREGKPYQAVVKIDGKRPLSGLSLRLRGRIDRFPDGQPVRCRQPGGREQRPICLVAISLDTVGIHDPAKDETLALWQPTADAPRSKPIRE
jgi:hypothetical protein